MTPAYLWALYVCIYPQYQPQAFCVGELPSLHDNPHDIMQVFGSQRKNQVAVPEKLKVFI